METIRQSLISVIQQLDSLKKKEQEWTAFLEKVGEKDLDSLWIKWNKMSDDCKKTAGFLEKIDEKDLDEYADKWKQLSYCSKKTAGFLEKVGEKDLDTILMKWNKMSDDSKKTIGFLENVGAKDLDSVSQTYQKMSMETKKITEFYQWSGESDLEKVLKEWEHYDFKSKTKSCCNRDNCGCSRFWTRYRNTNHGRYKWQRLNNKIDMIANRIAQKLSIPDTIKDQYELCYSPDRYEIIFPYKNYTITFLFKNVEYSAPIPYKYKRRIWKEICELSYLHDFYMENHLFEKQFSRNQHCSIKK